MNDIVNNLIEVSLIDEQNFLKIKETLTRIGVASRKEKKLYQSCHILHKRGKYYILHFKELFLLDGKTSTLSKEDEGRRNTIINLLEEWNLLKVIDPDKIQSNVAPFSRIKVISYQEKPEWELIAKYNIGIKR